MRREGGSACRLPHRLPRRPFPAILSPYRRPLPFIRDDISINCRLRSVRRTLTIFSRELASYFATPLAYAFVIAFLVSGGILTFFVGDFFARGRADLEPFFAFNPWLYLVLVPALSMRLWVEEKRSGTLELLLTLPVRLWEAVIGKFLAAWCFAGMALLLTFPLWLTVDLLGHPDNAVILAGYLGSWLMAGALLAIGAVASAACTSRTAAFLATAALAFVLVAAGSPPARGLLRARAPARLADALAAASLSGHFVGLTRGVLRLADFVYFLSLIVAFLAASGIIVDLRKAD